MASSSANLMNTHFWELLNASAIKILAAVDHSSLVVLYSIKLPIIHLLAAPTFMAVIFPAIQHPPDSSLAPHPFLPPDVSPILLPARIQPLLQPLVTFSSTLGLWQVQYPFLWPLWASLARFLAVESLLKI